MSGESPRPEANNILQPEPKLLEQARQQLTDYLVDDEEVRLPYINSPLTMLLTYDVFRMFKAYDRTSDQGLAKHQISIGRIGAATANFLVRESCLWIVAVTRGKADFIVPHNLYEQLHQELRRLRQSLPRDAPAGSELPTLAYNALEHNVDFAAILQQEKIAYGSEENEFMIGAGLGLAVWQHLCWQPRHGDLS